jgi:hypothetical protein
MDFDPIELASVEEDDDDQPATREASAGARRRARLNGAVGITVALLATFMGICKVKDDNINQAMQQAQADRVDHWSFYQARNVRQEVAEAAVVQLKLQRATLAPAAQPAADEAIAHYVALAKEQSQKKDALKAQAENDAKTYDALNFRDDQFDLSDALLAIAISLLAVASVTQLWWLYLVALVPSGFGLLMGMSGLAGWSVHPDALVKLLS